MARPQVTSVSREIAMVINPLHPCRGQEFFQNTRIRGDRVIVHRVCGPSSELSGDEVYWFGPGTQKEREAMQKRFFANHKKLTELWMIWKGAKTLQESERARKEYMTLLTGNPGID